MRFTSFFLERDGLALRRDLVIAAHGTNDQFWTVTATDAERIRSLDTPWGEWAGWVRSRLGGPNLFRLKRHQLIATDLARVVVNFLAPEP